VKRVVLALIATTLGSASLASQTADTAATAAADGSVVGRALQLAQAGDTSKARALLDSALRTSTPADTSYASLLAGRASLSASAKDSSRFYGRLLVESPLSPYAEDALVALATIDETRGDRASAADRLTRFMLSYPVSPRRERVSAWLVRLLFEDAQLARACTALGWARAAVPTENVELRNRIEYYAPRCATLAADTLAADSVAAPPPLRTPSPPRRPTSPPAPTTTPPRTRSAATDSVTVYSIQVAAYETRAAADRTVRTLVARGIDARVDGTTQPFRVRIGRYPTQAEALKAAAALKVRGITGFLTTVRLPRP